MISDRFWVAALAATSLLAVSGQACAKVMTITYTGEVIYGVDTAGFFGAAGGSLDGLSYTARMVYDTSVGNHFQTATSDFLAGGEYEGLSVTPISIAELTINGKSVDITAQGLGTVDLLLTGTPSPSLTVFAYQDLYNPYAPFGSVPQTHILESIYPAAVGPDLTTPYEGDGTGPFSGDARFERWEDGVVVTDAFADLHPEHVSIQTGGIPEPSSWCLMIAGFAGLGGALRLRGRARPEARTA
jgi:hypothetical protein